MRAFNTSLKEKAKTTEANFQEYFISNERNRATFSGQYTDTLGEGSWICELVRLRYSMDQASLRQAVVGLFSKAAGTLDESIDLSHGMKRVEVTCHEVDLIWVTFLKMVYQLVCVIVLIL